MGLDGVEIIMATEERFGITIPDEDAEKMRTVGDLHHYVLHKLETQYPEDRCLTSANFYLFRRSCMRTLHVPRSDIKPSTRLSNLLPSRHRSSYWKQLRSETQLELPALLLPLWSYPIIFMPALLVLWVLHGQFGTEPALLLSIVIAAISYLIVSPHANRFPRQITTVRDLVYVVTPAEQQLPAETRHDPDFIWSEVKQIIVDQLRVDPAKVTPTADLVRDLGCR
jgi:acyl carrier protein